VIRIHDTVSRGNIAAKAQPASFSAAAATIRLKIGTPSVGASGAFRRHSKLSTDSLQL
jgi:hypothetical protein